MKKLFPTFFLLLLLTVSCEKIDDLFGDDKYQFDDPFKLDFNHKATVGSQDFDVKFLHVLEDSRCPTSVVCVWEGRAVVELEFEQNGTKILDTLATISTVPVPADSSIVFGRVVKLLEVNPYPKTPNSLSEKDYSIRLIVN